MKSFSYKIKDELGLHAQPCTRIALAVREGKSTVTVADEHHSALGDNPVSLLGLAAFKGTIVTVTIEGSDEDTVYDRLWQLFHEYL